MESALPVAPEAAADPAPPPEETIEYVNNLVVVSDTHSGCRMGLCPPDPIHMDQGGEYHYSLIQAKMWAMWEDFWHEWVPRVCHGERFAVALNGDTVDGVHHNSTTQISHDLGDQARIAQRILEPVVSACAPGCFYMIRGTEAHVGQSGVEEERLAKALGAKPDEFDNYARFELRIRVGGPNGPLSHIMHHIGTTGSAAHEASAVNAELTAEYVEAARWGQVPPDYVIRSHRHRCIAVDLDSKRGYAAAIVTPGWQAKTPFAYRIAGARLAPPQFGGVLVRQGDEEFYYRRKVYNIQPPTEEII